MKNELAKANQEIQCQAINEKDLKDYLFGSGTELSDEQFRLFVGIAKASNLNPFKREIYAIPYEKNFKNEKGQWEKRTDISIVCGYQIYIDRAMATGLLDGWEVEITTKGAKITIYRKDFKFPFRWEVSTKEFAKKKSDGSLIGTWAVMPEFMIKKVAIGQGFRLAFPNEMGGLPYLQEEISNVQEGQVEEIKEKKQEKPISEIQQENFVLYYEKLQKTKNTQELKIVYEEIKKNKFTKENSAELAQLVKDLQVGFKEREEKKPVDEAPQNQDFINLP